MKKQSSEESELLKYYVSVIQNTILSNHYYKSIDILSSNDINTSTQCLEKIYQHIESCLIGKSVDVDDVQSISDDMSSVIRNYGTYHLHDLIQITKQKTDGWDESKYEVLKKFMHPIHYKILPWKHDKKSASDHKLISKNRIVEDFLIVEKSVNLDCFDLSRISKHFYSRVYGIKLAIHNDAEQKTLIITGIVDNILLDCYLNYDYISNRINEIWNNVPKDPEFLAESFTRYVKSLSLRDLLVYSNDEIYLKYMSNVSTLQNIKIKQMSVVVREFLSADMYFQRTLLIQLLLKSNEHEYRYLAYMLYNMLSTEYNNSSESYEQTTLFNSLPWNIMCHFKDSVKQTIAYNTSISKFDSNNIPLEQQVCLMKTSENVKEKAMVKIKEIKSKSDDSASKARQYVEGLLRIPFGTFIKEDILYEMDKIRSGFAHLVSVTSAYAANTSLLPTTFSHPASSLEIRQHVLQIQPTIRTTIFNSFIDTLLDNANRSTIASILNASIKKYKLNNIVSNKISISKTDITECLRKLFTATPSAPAAQRLIEELIAHLGLSSPFPLIDVVDNDMSTIISKQTSISQYMKNVETTLNSAVYGHVTAKRQIKRIVGQWINGELNGYCFGFEGPPGVGKTSLAKLGISKCLVDANGNSRPFSFIAIGGSSNGSTLEGHNYTYVGSTWGKIADILMDQKCMNPIIFIDELDKISNTEHGREIIGILTHLIDSSQNMAFQDKYFNGIDLDLSKALFIFSYNDASLIDKILLDRIHRVKFSHISAKDKLIICRDYLLPEIYKLMGLDVKNIVFSDDNLNFIIEHYTCESGVRKLKELLFEIIGEINLQIITDLPIVMPIHLSNDDIQNVFLKERHKIIVQQIQPTPLCGVICGLWANALGRGGIIPIETSFFPCDRFLEFKLTGMQGDVMKESMNVAKTLAWSLLSDTEKKTCIDEFAVSKMQGLHVHCPEGATPKDGPSAGTAITCALYSLLSKKKISNTVAITGEINLQGNITAIGGLDLKILGGVRSGVTTFLFPSQNHKDYADFIEKHNEDVASAQFIEVRHISEVLTHIFI